MENFVPPHMINHMDMAKAYNRTNSFAEETMKTSAERALLMLSAIQCWGFPTRRYSPSARQLQGNAVGDQETNGSCCTIDIIYSGREQLVFHITDQTKLFLFCI